MLKEIRLTYREMGFTEEEVEKITGGSLKKFPKYATLFINWANRFSQGTRPKVVGQLSELIKQVPGKRLAEWEEWYLERHPEAIAAATSKIVAMLEQFKTSMGGIDRRLVERWVRDLVLVKTFIGLRVQEAILRKVSQMNSCEYRLASPAEESKGIDGYVGKRPVSIKPVSYKEMVALSERIDANVIYYSSTREGDGIIIKFA
ncbi:MAG: MjaI family restriction endonuclease [Halobacteria archaeon]